MQFYINYFMQNLLCLFYLENIIIGSNLVALLILVFFVLYQTLNLT